VEEEALGTARGVLCCACLANSGKGR